MSGWEWIVGGLFAVLFLIGRAFNRRVARKAAEADQRLAEHLQRVRADLIARRGTR